MPVLNRSSKRLSRSIYLILFISNKHFFLKKILHMRRRWGTPQNFCLAFIDELWKTRKIRILKKWKHLLAISSFYTCVPKTTTETEFFVILGHFLPFYHPLPLTAQKTKILTNEKNIWKCHHLKHFKLVQQKIWSYDTECERQIFLSF